MNRRAFLRSVSAVALLPAIPQVAVAPSIEGVFGTWQGFAWTADNPLTDLLWQRHLAAEAASSHYWGRFMAAGFLEPREAAPQIRPVMIDG